MIVMLVETASSGSPSCPLLHIDFLTLSPNILLMPDAAMLPKEGLYFMFLITEGMSRKTLTPRM